MSGRFHIMAGPREGDTFDVPPGGAVLLGRGSQSTVSLHDNTVSKVHCKLYEKDGGYYMEDLKSRNGVLVNKARVARCRLAAGDVIQLGRTKIEFRIGGETDIQTAIRPAVAVAETRAASAVELARTDERPPLKEDVQEDSAEHFLEEEPSRRESDAIFGRIALLNRMLTQAQIDECVAAQEASPGVPKRPLGEFLVEKGYLSPT
ncbi:MAG: FHA domain-containing protein, partial [Planctomycetes bacterium]|nr:FHA domain-containing protein [Planctomycetota bacterium]